MNFCIFVIYVFVFLYLLIYIFFLLFGSIIFSLESAVEHPWQEYLKTHGPSHLRRASRGLRLLTGQVLLPTKIIP